MPTGDFCCFQQPSFVILGLTCRMADKVHMQQNIESLLKYWILNSVESCNKMFNPVESLTSSRPFNLQHPIPLDSQNILLLLFTWAGANVCLHVPLFSTFFFHFYIFCCTSSLQLLPSLPPSQVWSTLSCSVPTSALFHPYLLSSKFLHSLLSSRLPTMKSI